MKKHLKKVKNGPSRMKWPYITCYYNLASMFQVSEQRVMLFSKQGKKKQWALVKVNLEKLKMLSKISQSATIATKKTMKKKKPHKLLALTQKPAQ